MSWSWSGVWFIWLIVLFMSFIVLEARAINRGGVTLSATVRGWAETWPLLPFMVGLVFGVLGAHFFWPWCPETMEPKCAPCEQVANDRDGNLQQIVAASRWTRSRGDVPGVAAAVAGGVLSASLVRCWSDR